MWDASNLRGPLPTQADATPPPPSSASRSMWSPHYLRCLSWVVPRTQAALAPLARRGGPLPTRMSHPLSATTGCSTHSMALRPHVALAVSACHCFDGLADRMVVSVHGTNFQWYFTGQKSFDGILRRSQPFDATQPIFPNKNKTLLTETK
jgi:hypothetical protein